MFPLSLVLPSSRCAGYELFIGSPPVIFVIRLIYNELTLHLQDPDAEDDENSDLRGNPSRGKQYLSIVHESGD